MIIRDEEAENSKNFNSDEIQRTGSAAQGERQRRRAGSSKVRPQVCFGEEKKQSRFPLLSDLGPSLMAFYTN